MKSINDNNRKSKASPFLHGLRVGVPIGLGYLSVSFTFGIMAVSYGLYWWQAVLISMLCVTSAGQLAGISVMLSPGHYVEMLISQITINIRYSFMSISLSQKVDKKFRGIWRWLFSFMMTDEIFAVAVTQENVTRSFFAGLMIIPYAGWTLGTLTGALLGNILPDQLMSALNIAIYGMFVAIVVPEMKRKLPSTGRHPVLFVVILAALFRTIFTYTPVLKNIPGGLAISVCAVASAVIGALVNPVEENSADH